MLNTADRDDLRHRRPGEETGLPIAVGREVWSLDLANGVDKVYEIHDFLARVVGGAMVAGDDAADVGWFGRPEMEHMPLTHDLLSYLSRYGML